MLTSILLLIAIAVFAADIRSIKGQSNSKLEKLFSSSLLGIGIIIGIAQLMQVKIPSMMTAIEYVYRPFSDGVSRMLK